MSESELPARDNVWLRARWLGHRALETWRFEGPRVLASRVGRLAVSPFGELLVYSYFRFDLTEPVELHEAGIEIFVAPLTEDEIPQVVPVILNSYNPARRALESTSSVTEMIEQRRARGATCFVARRKGRIVHYNWTFVGAYEGSEARIVLMNSAAHCDDGFTEEGSRGQGVHAAVNSRMLIHLQQLGFERAYTRATRDNVSSAKALHRVGWERFATLAVFTPLWSKRIFSWTLRGPLGPIVPRRTRHS